MRRPARLRGRLELLDRHPARALSGVVGGESSVLLLGLKELSDDCWAVLAAAGIGLVRVADVASAVRALTDQAAQVVIADARSAPALTSAVRARRELSSGAHHRLRWS